MRTTPRPREQFTHSPREPKKKWEWEVVVIKWDCDALGSGPTIRITVRVHGIFAGAMRYMH